MTVYHITIEGLVIKAL